MKVRVSIPVVNLPDICTVHAFPNFSLIFWRNQGIRTIIFAKNVRQGRLHHGTAIRISKVFFS